ncbi:MAG: 1-(5-phosphoribosyl)-5-[(5-phosphoribosylamino)methylideneamino]imidazole-4-carboxamide isomerase [Candidatus Omnitrophota bacterium]|nr:1-(5-phosphoribosyl)-5-[(5-phosphoribosylamino)methylideneamino]imidazole-4-carboxamide isomerase [Candidatus Omnitrophota bacterium]
MIIYPSIDLYDGKVVRLRRGDFSQETVYSTKPEEQARFFQDQGAEWIHVVDLNGAKTGEFKNRSSLSRIRNEVRVKIQYGGGVREIEHVEELIGEGVQRVVLGTKALEEEFFRKAIYAYGPKIAVSVDVRDEQVLTDGWLKTSDQTVQSFLHRLNDFPLETIIFTDVRKDGMLEGPNLDELDEVLDLTNANVILSGGISSLSDIEKCRQITKKNFEGVIIGKALYDKKFSLEEAVTAASAPGGGLS